jgi:hypothetical protein
MTLWDKIKGWVSGAIMTVETELSRDEKALLAIVQPLLGADEAAAMQDLVQFVTGLVAGAGGARTLADWETAVLNGLGAAESELLTLAKGLGSNLLQSLIGLVLSRLATAGLSAL